MRKVLLTVLFCIATVSLFGQAPQAFSYQAVAYNSSGVVVTNPIALEISIHDSSLTGTIVYKERFTGIQPTTQGVFSLNIGTGTVQSPFTSTTFKNINWGTNSKYLEVKIDPTNPGTGTNYTVSGGNQLMSVPYALFSAKTGVEANVVTVKNVNDLKLFTDFNPATDTPTVYVQGYNSPSDGGGGTFIFKRYTDMGTASPGGVDPKPVQDGGIFIDSYNGNFTPHGIWIRQFSGDIDIRYYGVFGTGGTTDQGPKIQYAINYAHKSIEDVNNRPYGHNGSNTVYLPNGQYIVGQIVIKTGVTIKGASMTNTTIQSLDDSNNALVVMPEGVNRDIHFRDINFYGNASTYFNNFRHKSCFSFVGIGTIAGLWESSFKNVTIQKFTGHSFYFQGSVTQNNYGITNQFITMEGVNVESVGQLRTDSNNFTNDYHALELNGLNGQFAFNNCRFDGGAFLYQGSDIPQHKVNGISVYIGTTVPGINPAMINFNNCTFQTAETAIQIESCNNVNIIGCWFEHLERSIVVKGRYRKSKAINILNSSFSNAAGKLGILDSGSGRVIIAENSHLNVQNNFIIESTELDDPTRFISVDPINGAPASNLGISASGNYFEDKKFGYSYGIKKDVILTNTSPSVIDLEGAKAIYLKNTTGNILTIDEFKSSTSPGEFIFIRADQGSIRFNESKNIYLGNMNDPSIVTNPPNGQLTINNGGIAIFVKIDEIILNGMYQETYNLVSYKLRN